MQSVMSVQMTWMELTAPCRALMHMVCLSKHRADASSVRR